MPRRKAVFFVRTGGRSVRRAAAVLLSVYGGKPKLPPVFAGGSDRAVCGFACGGSFPKQEHRHRNIAGAVEKCTLQHRIPAIVDRSEKGQQRIPLGGAVVASVI